MSVDTASHIAILTTVATPEEGLKIARELVARRLAACVNVVGPIRSVFRWKGEIQEAAEHLLVVKTNRESFDRVAQAVREMHSYELPELIALPVVAGEETYLNWLTAAASDPPGELP